MAQCGFGVARGNLAGPVGTTALLDAENLALNRHHPIPGMVLIGRDLRSGSRALIGDKAPAGRQRRVNHDAARFTQNKP
jgi:hypothetical protein